MPGETLFTTGHEAEVLTEVTGDLDAPFVQTNTLKWKSDNNNYIVLESDTNDNFDGIKPSTLNNLVIASKEILNRPPDYTNAAPSISSLWPPNHELEQINIVGVTDPDGDSITITIDGIFQDEPTNSTADGDTAPRWVRRWLRHSSDSCRKSGETRDSRVYRVSSTLPMMAMAEHAVER